MKDFVRPLPKSYPTSPNPFMCWACQRIFSALGWRITGEYPVVSKAVMAIAPHTSNWDFVIGMLAKYSLQLKITVMAKNTLFFWPLGILMRVLGCFPIDRSNAGSFVTQGAANLVNAKDKSILVIAPEGTRSEVDNWKTGFVRIAHEAQVPILLIGFDYSSKTIHFEGLLITTGDVDADVEKARKALSKLTGLNS